MNNSTKIKLLITSIIPGLSQIFIGKCLKGIIIFMVFAIFFNGIYIGAILWQGSPSDVILKISLGCAAIIWVYSLADTIKYLFATECSKNDK